VLSVPKVFSLPFTEKKLDKIGIQVYTIREEMKKDFTESLKKLSEIGYDYIELYDYENGRLFNRSVEEVKLILDDLGLTATSSHVGISNLRNNWNKIVDDAATLGQKYIVCPNLDPPERSTVSDYLRIAELFNKSAEVSRKSSIQFAYHNHAFEFDEIEGEIPMDVLLRETDKDLVKFQMDIYWINKGGFNHIEYFKKHPGRFALWHVKDMDNTSERLTTEVGAGIIDWAEAFRHTDISGMEYFFVEQEDFTIPIFESVEKSYQYLKSLSY